MLRCRLRRPRQRAACVGNRPRPRFQRRRSRSAAPALPAGVEETAAELAAVPDRHAPVPAAVGGARPALAVPGPAGRAGDSELVRRQGQAVEWKGWKMTDATGQPFGNCCCQRHPRQGVVRPALAAGVWDRHVAVRRGGPVAARARRALPVSGPAGWVREWERVRQQRARVRRQGQAVEWKGWRMTDGAGQPSGNCRYQRHPRQGVAWPALAAGVWDRRVAVPQVGPVAARARPALPVSGPAERAGGSEPVERQGQAIERTGWRMTDAAGQPRPRRPW